MDKLEQFLDRAEALLGRFEALLPPAPADVDWNAATAFRWRKRQGRGYLQAVPAISQIALDDLHNIDRQKGLIEQNTRQFVTRRPANNVLLTGARAHRQVLADQGLPQCLRGRRSAADRGRQGRPA